MPFRIMHVMHSVSSAPAARQVSRSPSGVPASAMAWTVGGGKGARALRSLRRALVQEVSGENEMLDLLHVVLRDDLGLPLPQHQFDVPTAREVVMDRLERLMGLGPGSSHGGQEHGGQAAQHPQGLQTWHDGQAAQHPQQHQQGPPTWQQEQQGSWQQGQQWPWSRSERGTRASQGASHSWQDAQQQHHHQEHHRRSSTAGEDAQGPPQQRRRQWKARRCNVCNKQTYWGARFGGCSNPRCPDNLIMEQSNIIRRMQDTIQALQHTMGKQSMDHTTVSIEEVEGSVSGGDRASVHSVPGNSGVS